MRNRDFEGYYVIWLDEDGKEIGNEWISKPTYSSAVRMISLRLYQSPHRCPKDVGGFYIEHIHVYRRRHGQPENKLGEVLDAQS